MSLEVKSEAPDKPEPKQSLIPDNRPSLRELLSTDESPAVAVYRAVTNIIGEGEPIDDWESETVEICLEKHGYSISEVNLNQCLVIMALRSGYDVFTSANVFQNMVLAINGEIPNPQVDEDIDVEQIAVAILVILQVQEGADLQFDYEPIQFIARELHEEGFFIAPQALEFAQEELDKLNYNCENCTSVREAMKDGSTEDPVIQVQLEKHKRVMDYIQAYSEHQDSYLKKYKL